MYGNNGYAGVNNQGGYSYANPQNLYVGSPVEEVKALNQEASKQYDEGVSAKNALDLLYNNLDVEERGKHIKDRAFGEYVGKIKDLAKNGNYQDAKYLMNDLTQSYKNDKELQGALKSRASEKTYYEDLRNRLEAGTQAQTSTEKDKDGKEVTKRTGGINKDIYEYAIRNTKKNNLDKLEYDPETGLITNSFKGHNVIDDKSKEIYDYMDKTIKDWKEGDIKNVNGIEYERVPGGYINFKTKVGVEKDEVQNALKTQLDGIGEYKDFMNQERDIHINKITGGTGNISLEALSKLGVSDGTLMKAVNDGATQEDFNDYYKQAYKESQLDKYTNPASDKASYEHTKNDLKLDEIMMEALKSKNRMKEKKAEQELSSIKLPTEPTSLISSRPQDVIDHHQKLLDIAKQKNDLLNELKNPQVTPERTAEINKDLSYLNTKEKLAKKNDSDYEDAMKRNGDNINENYADAFDNLTLGKSQGQLKIILANEILKLPANEVSSTLRGQATNILKGEHTSLSTEDFLNESDKFIKSKNILKKLKDYVKDEANKVEEPGVLGTVLHFMSRPSEHNPFSDSDNLLDFRKSLIKRKEAYIEKEKASQYTTNALLIDEDNNNNKKNENPFNAVAREKLDQISSGVRNASAEWKLEGGKSLYNLTTGEEDGYEMYDETGKKAKPDLTKSKIGLNTISNPTNGETPVAVTFKDKDGNSLYFKNNKQAFLHFYPTNGNVTADVNRNLAEAYFKNGKEENIREGIKLAADVDVKALINKQINIENIRNEPKGYAEDFVLDNNHYKLVSTGTGEFYLADADDKKDRPIVLPRYGKVPMSNFKSLEELSEAIYTTKLDIK